MMQNYGYRPRLIVRDGSFSVIYLQGAARIEKKERGDACRATSYYIYYKVAPLRIELKFKV